ncbi:Alpha/beta hydrolase [Hyphomicrobiales bacterium]|nr:Alpha/beta hydrolase [Hyphomicrobiales bacterium]CAH1690974.1 Alpha/beta hydrolase [Hyphomicrobiales bacterium]
MLVCLLLVGFSIPAMAQNLATDGGVSIHADGPGIVTEQPIENIPSGGNMFDIGKTVAAGDTALFVSIAGKTDGEPIILLHGGMGSRNDFLPLAKHLSAEYRLVAIDSRGHGRSAMGGGSLTYHQLEQDIAAVLAELGLAEAGIIGHSDGGIVALRLAASGIVRPRFVVVVGVHWQMPADEPTREIYQGITVDEWRGMFSEQVQNYEAENPAPDFVRLFDATKAMWLGNDDQAYPGASVRSITSPLLVVHGDEDFLVSRRQACDLVEQVEGARLLNLPFASHTVLEDSPEDVLPSLKAFLASSYRAANLP